MIVKDESTEHPVPEIWRQKISSVVNAFINDDYTLANIKDVAPVPSETAHQIKEYIEDYDDALIPIPDNGWASSVCLWMGDHWDVLIDLFTESESPSDLVLSAKVFENGTDYDFRIQMVYVP